MLVLAFPLVGLVSVALTILHIIICVFLIGVVLLQRGRSQDLASAFGGGQTQANVAAMSTDDFLTRATKISAFLFMGTSLGLALSSQWRATSVLDVVPGPKPVAHASAPTGPSGATTGPVEAAPVLEGTPLTPQGEPPAEPSPTAPPTTPPPTEGGPTGTTGGT